MNQKYAILILSCDKYQDLWSPFFELFFKNWPDCPYKVYLGSNYRRFNHRKVKNILIGKDADWSTSLKKILHKIPEKYLFILLEDTFIIREIDGELFSKCFNFVEKKDANHLHFVSLPNVISVPKELKFMLVNKFSPYRAHVIGFWKKDYLQRLILDGENPWNFEIMGSYRSSYDEGFFSLEKPLYTSIHLVKKDRWIPKSLNFCMDNNIKIEASRRRKLNLYEMFLYNSMEYYFTFIYFHVNWKLRVGLMNILRKALLSY